jgi:predicted permease
MLADIRDALRGLRKSPGFTLVALLTLALGTGGVTAMFSLVNTALLKPLAWRDSGQLCTIMLQIPGLAAKYPVIPVNAAHLMEWREHSRAFEGLALVQPAQLSLTGVGEAETLTGVSVTADALRLLGLSPRLGRDFEAGEEWDGENRVLILSDGLWRRKFGGDPEILGRKIMLNHVPHEVVGVMPPETRLPHGGKLDGFMRLPRRIDFLKPVGFTKEEVSFGLGNMNYVGLGRLRTGLTAAQGMADLNAIEPEIAKSYREPVEIRSVVEPIRETMVGDSRRPLLLLLGAVGFVLLVVCINLANLLLVRAAARRRELAVRLALGASLGALMRRVLAESLVLSFAGGALGLVLATWLLEAIVAGAPVQIARLDETRLDGFVLAFSFAVSCLAGLLLGAFPAWKATRSNPQEALHSASRRTTDGPSGHRTRSALVLAEVALSVVLLLGAGLLLHSLFRVLNLDRGFDSGNLLAAEVTLPAAKYRDGAQRLSFFRELERKAGELPGVQMAGLVSALPVTSETFVNAVYAGDRPAAPMAEWPVANYRMVTPEYFQVMRIPPLNGRMFEEKDGDTKMVVVSQNLAERLWPGEDPVGRSLREFGDPPYPRVVGVVGNVPAGSLVQGPTMIAYFPLWQRPHGRMSVVVRTAGDPQRLAGPLTALVRDLDAEIPIPETRTMDEVISDSVAVRRFQMMLLLGFAMLALLLASLGIYGVISQAVAQRTGEVGIRMALGARASEVRNLLLRQGMKPVLAGVAVGMIGSIVAGRLLESMLFGIRPLDPFSYTAVPAVVTAVALLACLIPANRAARIEPLEALREE